MNSHRHSYLATMSTCLPLVCMMMLSIIATPSVVGENLWKTNQILMYWGYIIMHQAMWAYLYHGRGLHSSGWHYGQGSMASEIAQEGKSLENMSGHENQLLTYTFAMHLISTGIWVQGPYLGSITKRCSYVAFPSDVKASMSLLIASAFEVVHIYIYINVV